MSASLSRALLRDEEGKSGQETKILVPVGPALAEGPFVLAWADRDGLPRELKLKGDRTLIGTAESCDVLLDDEYVSARHCEIGLEGDTLYLRDLRSTNGTFVNGVRAEAVALVPGSAVRCGTTVLQVLAGDRRRVRAAEYPWSVPLIGRSPSFLLLKRQIERVAPLEQNLFIHGETGTGKELVAAALHELSPRKDAPFIAINCGAISKDLMESELFGHEKGAFTGAQQRRAGAFELANGGTLFLDEIGELPIELQPKLLRVLETGGFRRLGGREEIRVSVRIFSATHRDLAQSIRFGRFREDLYYRLYILPVEVSPLRKRVEDIPMLVDFFVSQAVSEGRAISVAPEAHALLKAYHWPGNVRELRNVVYRALAFAEGSQLGVEHFSRFLQSVSMRDPSQDPDLLDSLSPLKQKERELVLEALRHSDGNQTEAARRLGIGRTTLYYKIKEYGIELRRRVSG